MSNFDIHSQISVKKQKSKEDYSRNVKKLKYKLLKISDQIQSLQQRIQTFQNTSNDQIIAMKLSKFCKERRFTPQMIFRFADKKCRNNVSRIDFKNTLNSIGLKFTQHELTRLQYLLDQDISGEISWDQYNKYLYAFNIKKQYNPDDPFMKNALQKLDLNKIIEISKNNGDKNDKKSKHRNLLNYEQFLKYCHKNFPELSNKELASIFNKLKKNQLIDLDDLIQYLSNLQEQRRRLQEKNKQKKKKQQQLTQQEEQIIDINTLKGVIMALLKYHPKQQRNFHSSEFQRLQKIYEKPRGSLVSLFKKIDKKIKGSIGYNELICFYAQDCKKDSNKLTYIFKLMGKKLVSEGQKPQTLISTYAKQKQHIEYLQFQKLCLLEFQLKPQIAKILYDFILNRNEKKQTQVLVKDLVNIMNIDGRFKTIIKPSLWNTYPNQFYNKDNITICNDGFVALRLCLSIAEQIHAIKQINKWDDFEFGPTFQDQLGLDSIKIPLPNSNIKWIRAQKLGMKDFYIPSRSNRKKPYFTSSLCPHQLFNKSLEILIRENENFISRADKQIVKIDKTVEEVQLNKLFEGVHPLIFHDFQQWGIVVVKFYIRGKWVYVITDDKIPCDQNNQPLFSSVAGRNCSYISLVEKAYAKLKGSYLKAYQSFILGNYIYELSSILTYDFKIDNFDNVEENQVQWQKILSQLQKKSIVSQQKKNTQNNYDHSCVKRSYLVNMSFKDRTLRENQKSGLQKNLPLNILHSLQIKDERSQNSHKSHRLIICTYPYLPFLPQHLWNPSWNRSQQNTKYKKFSSNIITSIKQFNSSIQDPSNMIDLGKDSAIIIMNYKLVRNMFNTLVCLQKVLFEEMIILRKVVQFQKDFKCLYKVNSTEGQIKTVKLIILLNKIKAPQDSIVRVQMKKSNQKKDKNTQPNITSYHTREQFVCFCLQVPYEQQDLEIWVQNMKQKEEYVYQLTFYFQHPRYSLKQRDRHLLFRYVSQYQQSPQLDFGKLQQKLKQYLYDKYFKNAGRKGVLCC